MWNSTAYISEQGRQNYVHSQAAKNQSNSCKFYSKYWPLERVCSHDRSIACVPTYEVRVSLSNWSQSISSRNPATVCDPVYSSLRYHDLVSASTHHCFVSSVHSTVGVPSRLQARRPGNRSSISGRGKLYSPSPKPPDRPCSRASILFNGHQKSSSGRKRPEC